MRKSVIIGISFAAAVLAVVIVVLSLLVWKSVRGSCWQRHRQVQDTHSRNATAVAQPTQPTTTIPAAAAASPALVRDQQGSHGHIDSTHHTPGRHHHGHHGHHAAMPPHTIVSVGHSEHAAAHNTNAPVTHAPSPRGHSPATDTAAPRGSVTLQVGTGESVLTSEQEMQRRALQREHHDMLARRAALRQQQQQQHQQNHQDQNHSLQLPANELPVRQAPLAAHLYDTHVLHHAPRRLHSVDGDDVSQASHGTLPPPYDPPWAVPSVSSLPGYFDACTTTTIAQPTLPGIVEVPS